MTTKCQMCDVDPFKYKCPTCYIKYCSVACFKLHREAPCVKPEQPQPCDDLLGSPHKYKFATDDTVPIEKLQELGTESKEVKACLSNPHVRGLLTSLVHSQNPDTSIKEAMQEPIFLELAHACLKIVEPEKIE
nr:EOG090X0JQ4 [Eurycercus lamellatus]